MFSSGPNYNKLKTNLRLAVNRLKLLEKKKTELAQKARKEITDYIVAGKAERAKIRVEHIIREDYLVEAMEIVECYCDMLLARMGLIQQMKTLDEGLAEPISSILWVAPRMQADVAELQVISAQLTAKYGKEYLQACRENSLGTVSPKLMHKLSVQAPPKILVEKYLIEIAKNYNVEYEPDPGVMANEGVVNSDGMLINLNDDEDNRGDGAGGSSGGAGGGFPEPTGSAAFNLPGVPSNGSGPPPPLGFVDPKTMSAPSGTGMQYPLPEAPYNPYAVKSVPSEPERQEKTSNVNFNYPTPAPRTSTDDALNLPDVPAGPNTFGLPSPHGGVPNLPPPGTDDETNFDDLTKRFEALKKKK
ncbi:IST1 homolog [Amphibalanus amphitrite]|uniref:IST1 homolog n=1 Tax=Amphibalanus amphitrite TaxID=1232801 RepID=UPI001C8FD337|nr:IST1 homolog [Amphibalanus amphitrite]